MDCGKKWGTQWRHPPQPLGSQNAECSWFHNTSVESIASEFLSLAFEELERLKAELLHNMAESPEMLPKGYWSGVHL